MKSLAQAKLKRTRAVELVAQGRSYDEIARAVGYRHRGSAHRAVYKALAERQVEAVEDLRALEAARLDRLQGSLWERAMGGDLAAMSSVLRIIQQRMRLLGLDQPGDDDRQCGLRHLVVGPPEGNPGDATRS